MASMGLGKKVEVVALSRGYSTVDGSGSNNCCAHHFKLPYDNGEPPELLSDGSEAHKELDMKEWYNVL